MFKALNVLPEGDCHSCVVLSSERGRRRLVSSEEPSVVQHQTSLRQPAQRCVCVRQRESVCVCETERECVCVRQRVRVCVRESVCVCVCVYETERECVCETERVCV